MFISTRVRLRLFLFLLTKHSHYFKYVYNFLSTKLFAVRIFLEIPIRKSQAHAKVKQQLHTDTGSLFSLLVENLSKTFLRKHKTWSKNHHWMLHLIPYKRPHHFLVERKALQINMKLNVVRKVSIHRISKWVSSLTNYMNSLSIYFSQTLLNLRGFIEITIRMKSLIDKGVSWMNQNRT